MSKPSQSKYKHIFQNLNIKRAKSGKKYKKAINRFISTLKKIETKGATPLLVNEKKRVMTRLKKFGVSDEQITKSLNHKGLTHLVANTYID